MKISKLLVLTALWLGMGSSAMAEVPEGVWTMPQPTGLEVVTTPAFDGTHYVLYNPAAKLFFASGNDWNTRASVATFGYEVWFTATEESGTPANPRVAPEGSYFFNDDCQHPDRILGAKDLFTDGGGATWVDRDPGNAGQTDFYWSVTKVGDFYRIQNTLFAAKEGNEGKFIGWKSGSDTRLYMILPEEGTVDWQFVTAESYMQFTYDEAYEEYKAKGNTYFSGVGLEASLKEAEELNIDIAEWLAVYTNTESSKEELDAAKTAVDAVVTNKKNLQKIVDRGAVVNAPIGEAQLLLANSSATAEELKAAIDTLTPIVEAREALKKALDEAKQAGFEATAAYDAVYNNQEATTTELKKALEDLSAEVIEWGKTHATWDKPADMTAKIVNPTFDNGNLSGWSGDAFGRGGTVADGAEHYSKNYDTYQKITGLTPGVYAVGVNGFYRAGNYGGDAERHWLANDEASKYAKLYGKAGANYYEAPIANVMSGAQTENPGGMEVTYTDPESGEGVTVYVPNTMAQGDIYFHEIGQYANKVYVAVSEGDTLTIGVKKTTQIGGDWSLFDDFSLSFYGAGADACQGFINEAMKNFSEYQIEEGTLYTAAYLTAYQQAYQGEKIVSTMAEVNTILNAITTAKADLDKNIELWKTYKKKVEDSFAKYCQSTEYDICISTGDLSDYYDMDIKTVDDEEFPGYKTICSEHKLTNEELEAEIAFVDALCDQIDKEAKEGLKEGDDVTRFIKNADFEMCDVNTQTGEAPYWTVKKDVGNVTAGPLGQDNYNLMVSALGQMNYCFESWHSHDFDVYQEVNNVPEGVYVIEAQGFVRCENAGYSRPNDVDKKDIPVRLYLNNATDVFPNVYSELAADLGHEYTTVESWTTEDQGGNLYPNSMGGAAQCFGWGMYKMQTFGLVKEGETMRIGVKGKMKTDDTENWWCIWDNFKLTFQGYNVTYVKPALDLAMENIDISKPMGKKVYDTAKGLTDKYNDAVATGDGKTMFQMLADVYDATAAISSSVELFAELYSANEALNEATYLSKNTAAIAEAGTLYNTIANGILNHEYDDADVEGLMNQIAAARTKLGFPNDWENASDDNPKDFTGVIVNPAYDEGIDGWSGTAAAYGSGYQNAEIFGSNFDYYQDIEGLPAGTYQVTVQGFYRAGGAEDDYKAYKENAELLNHAFIYAMTSLNGDTAIASKPMKRLAAEAASEIDLGYVPDGYVYAAKETEEGLGDGWLVPNTMDAAGDAFSEEKYLNEGVTFKLTEGAKLRIGLKKNVNIDNNWTLFDNWQLTYFGKNSGKTADDDASGINTINESVQVKIEYFTLDGRKANRAQKGIMIQKMTLGNGATIVRKIQK